MNTYEVIYLEGELGHSVTITVDAETKEEAEIEAKKDYYFWKLVYINELS